MQIGGAEMRTVELCRHLISEHDIAVDYFTTMSNPGALDDEIRAWGGQIYTAPPDSNPVALARAFRQCLRWGGYDIVHSHLHLFSGLMLALAAREKVPTRIAHFRNMHDGAGKSISRRAYRQVMRGLINRFATDIVGVSKAALVGGLGTTVQDERSTVIYNAVDLDRFRIASGRAETREILGWGTEAPVVINVARLAPQKNHETVIETAQLVARERDDVRFLIVGDGPLREQIKQLISEKGLDQIVRCTGNRDDVPALLASSDAFLFPSRWEGLPGAPLEALAAGLSVVGSDIPPMREIADYFPGRVYLAQTDDADLHTQHLLQVLDEPPLARAEAQAAIERSPFSMASATAGFAHLYGLC
jgi:glycosyltransferase involved in cell wall biosynthesis